jgi:hypothetical protein
LVGAAALGFFTAELSLHNAAPDYPALHSDLLCLLYIEESLSGGGVRISGKALEANENMPEGLRSNRLLEAKGRHPAGSHWPEDQARA